MYSKEPQQSEFPLELKVLREDIAAIDTDRVTKAAIGNTRVGLAQVRTLSPDLTAGGAGKEVLSKIAPGASKEQDILEKLNDRLNEIAEPTTASEDHDLSIEEILSTEASLASSRGEHKNALEFLLTLASFELKEHSEPALLTLFLLAESYEKNREIDKARYYYDFVIKMKEREKVLKNKADILSIVEKSRQALTRINMEIDDL